ncbi:uncharacterized protein LOC132760007 [Ruditapes philippinarum]|uniref:uncharacterized protein LOC132760007 n=1 Tax=Ruditapes philippinarum TaxID=129788 RepID=UPI00295AF4AD|nr:uncharacterized protein LOC132760007 [Ruditapes philippinarum]
MYQNSRGLVKLYGSSLYPRHIYRRSLEKRGLRYTVFVGDGDSSSYRSVIKQNIYGPDIKITKENCVGHIQKRMGNKLRKIVQENKGRKLDDGKCISGRGRLTHKVIDSFQVFYGIGLRTNKGNLDAMQKATRAIIAHYSATPENPTHDLCPNGEDSWCKFQVDKAQGTDTYKFPKYPLPVAVTKEIEPIIEELSSESLLKTCQMGLTQNANEACHSILWKLVSKRQYNSESAYRLSTAMTVGHWKLGPGGFQ